MNRHKKFSSIGNEVDPRKPYITKARRITKIIFHCSATQDGKEFSAKDIDAMHMRRWGVNSGCGYHYIITADGRVEKGRWSDSAGSHAGPKKEIGRPSSNVDTIAVCYIGGVDKKQVALKEGLRPRQRVTAEILLSSLQRGYGLQPENVIGHNELPKVNKGCPCTDMQRLRKEIKRVNYKTY